MRLVFFLKCANIEYELQYIIFTVFIWKKKEKSYNTWFVWNKPVIISALNTLHFTNEDLKSNTHFTSPSINSISLE